MDALAPLLAVAALVISLVAVWLVLRAPAAVPPADALGWREVHAPTDAGGAGTAADERHVADRLAALEARARETGPAASLRIGMVRFNAYDDTGGSQSFALALVDVRGDGVVLSSLHSRQSTRLYIKGLAGGTPDAPLSVEEARALERAGLRVATPG